MRHQSPIASRSIVCALLAQSGSRLAKCSPGCGADYWLEKDVHGDGQQVRVCVSSDSTSSADRDLDSPALCPRLRSATLAFALLAFLLWRVRLSSPASPVFSGRHPCPAPNLLDCRRVASQGIRPRLSLLSRATHRPQHGSPTPRRPTPRCGVRRLSVRCSGVRCS